MPNHQYAELMMTPEEPKVSDNGMYNKTDTCKALGISWKTLDAMMDKGRIIPCQRIGERRILFKGREIKRAWGRVLG